MEYNFDEIVIHARTGLNPRKNFILGKGNNRYITIKNIKNNSLVIDDNTDFIDDEAVDMIHKRSQIKKGDILFASIGRFGDTYIIEEEPTGWDINESVFAFTVNEKLIRQKYFHYLFKHKETIRQLTKNSSGSTFKSIKMNQLKKMRFNLPDLNSQDIIVSLLDCVTNIISIYEQELLLLDELVKARFVEMFGDPNYNPKGYKKDIIKDHIDLLSGYPFKSENYVDSGINICGGLVIMPQKIKWEECVHWKSAIGYENYLLNNNDIVMALDRPWISEGFKIAKVDSKHLPALLIQRTVRIRSIDMNQDYLYYCFICGGFNKHCNVTGSLVPHISSKDIKSFEVMLPPLELQNQFASFVQEIDKSRSRIQKSLEASQELFDSLMQEYFG